MFQNKPFRPKFNISFIPIQALGVKDGAAAMEAFRTRAVKGEGVSIIADEDRVLAGGRLDAVLLEVTEPHEEGYKRHVLALIVSENDILYIVGAAIPEEKWNDRYAQVVRASFRTFEAWRATFAACLKGKGAVLYSAFDCPHCETQKEIFTEGIEHLPYVECQQGIDDSSETDVCRDKNITGYPTWEFADGSRLIGVQTLKALGDKTGCKMF